MCTQLHFSLFTDTENFLNSVLKLHGVVHKKKGENILLIYHGRKISIQTNVLIGQSSFLTNYISKLTKPIAAQQSIRMISVDNLDSNSALILKLEAYMMFLKQYPQHGSTITYKIIVYKDGIFNSIPDSISLYIQKIKENYPNSIEIELLEELDYSRVVLEMAHAHILFALSFKDTQFLELSAYLSARKAIKSDFYSYIYSEFAMMRFLTLKNEVNPFDLNKIAHTIHYEIVCATQNRSHFLDIDINYFQTKNESNIVKQLLSSLLSTSKIVICLAEKK